MLTKITLNCISMMLLKEIINMCHYIREQTSYFQWQKNIKRKFFILFVPFRNDQQQ